ncbi:MAG: SDR family oxidoreductase [Spirochaetes bacterium]|nr:SDR family oxidoreductase [Spirochaetota bacterium]
MKFFDGKRVYITGGSSGIGLEIARQLSREGAHVLLFARDPGRLERARADVEKNRRGASQKIAVMAMDVRNAASVERIIARAAQEFGAPDILVNSAGIGHADYFENITYETFDSVMQINLYGTRNVIAAALPHMKERGGTIVIISSIAGHLGMFGYTAYGTSKFALVGFSECLRGDLKRYGIRVMVACPPETDTPLVAHESKTIPPEARAVKNMAGLLKPDFVARRVIRGIRRGRYLVIPGFLAKSLYFMQCYLPGWMIRLTADMTAGRAARKPVQK